MKVKDLLAALSKVDPEIDVLVPEEIGDFIVGRKATWARVAYIIVDGNRPHERQVWPTNVHIRNPKPIFYID